MEKNSESLGHPPNDYTALLTASFLGLRCKVKLLVEKGADPNGQSGQMDSPLIVSASKGPHEFVRLLLAAGADINTNGKQYSNALFAALYNCHHAIVKLLLDEDADVNAELLPIGDSYISFVKERIKFLESLKEVPYSGKQCWSHVVVRKLQYDGFGRFGSVLQTAIYEEHQEIAHFLLERGADPNVQSGRFGNSLQIAVYKEDLSTVQTLLGKGADVNAPTMCEITLQIAIFKGNETLVRLLLQNGADCNSKGTCDRKFKDLALLHRDWDTVRLLEQRNQPRSHEDVFDNAIRVASSLGNEGIVQLLIDHGADVDARTGHGEPPLKVAS